MPLTQQDIEPLLISFRSWLSNENINGLYVGMKKVAGKETSQLALIVEVEKKKPGSRLNQDDIPIPPEVELQVQAPDGTITNHKVPTDVVEVGVIRACVLNQKVRPTPGGYQISTALGLFGENTGTLGVNIVWGGKYRLLTNNHVIAKNNNTGGTIYQPDQGLFGNSLTTLTSYVPIKTYPNKNQPDPIFNATDLAWCDVTATEGATNITQIGQPTGFRDPVLNEQVRWIGKNTATVQNTVIQSIDGFLKLEFTSGQWAWFEKVIRFAGGFAQQGDSGAAIVAQADMTVLGLLFALNTANNAPYACHIP